MINFDLLPKSGGVYKITSPTGKIYIGQTKNLRARLKKYSNLNCQKQPKLYSSLIKHGFENHSVEVLILTDNMDELNEKEIFFINEFKTYDTKNGLNLTKGGEGMRKQHSEKTKKRISEGVKNSEKYKLIMASNEYREKLSKSLLGHKSYNKGIKRSEQDVLKIKEGIKNHYQKNPTRKHTEFSKIKMSESRKGHNNNNSKKRKIIYDGEIYNFDCQKYIKNFLNDLNEKLNLRGPKRFSFDALINKGRTKDIVMIK
jgi:group I intron endonuclease